MGQQLNNPDCYTYRVAWSEEDGEYVALCIEYPSLSNLASTRDEALEGIATLVRDVVAELVTNGEPIPELKVANLKCVLPW